MNCISHVSESVTVCDKEINVTACNYLR